MSSEPRDKLSTAERLVEAGDYRTARTLAKELAREMDSLEPSERARLSTILAGTGIDPAVIAGFSLTLAVIVFLLVKYVI